MHKHYSPQGKLFGSMVGYIGGAGLLVSWVMGSIFPILVAVVALFATLCYMNGLADAKPSTV